MANKCLSLALHGGAGAIPDRSHEAEIAFMGDDVNDLAAIAIAGFSACPADAHESVRSVVNLVSRFPGGNGAVREMLDHLDLVK